MTEQKFSIEEIRKYILSQDSLGDVLYNLKPDKIAEANRPTLFSIDGYFVDDNTEFSGYLVSAYDDTPEDDDGDDIFFYGLSEQDIVDAIEYSYLETLKYDIQRGDLINE